jgi:DNA adenine methylase
MDSLVFLRWIGGKTKTVNILAKFVPSSYGCYWEPFLGGASLFFLLKPEISILADSNSDLINCYQVVKDNPSDLSYEIESHRIRHSENYCYQIREQYNQGGDNVEQAGRFIYLNKACFNGIYRVNKEGKFNVPYGNKVTPSLPNSQKLDLVSKSLQKAKIVCGSFERTVDIQGIKPNDFIYFDPPYPPINEK